MIKVFTGDDRVRATSAIKQYLGDDYETIDCASLTTEDLPNIFHGATLFASHRHILLRDFTANSIIAANLENYLDTTHDVALFETKLDKRSAVYKLLKSKNVPILEFTATDPRQNLNQKFDIYRLAKRDGKLAVKKLRELVRNNPTEDPIMFTGLIASQAIKDFAATGGKGIKEKRILKALRETDLEMKTTSVDGWLLLESFLLRMREL